MSLRNFYLELSKGLPSPVYLISSPDDFLLYESLTLIKEKQTASDSLNLNVYDIDPSEGGVSIKEIVGVLNTFPFFGQKRTVVLKNIQKMPKKETKKLTDYFLNPSDFTLLIMLCGGEYKKIFDPVVLKKVKLIHINIQGNDIPSWIQEKAKKKGIELKPRAVEYLISTAGEDLAMLNSEIEKFSLLGKNIIDINEIKEIVYDGAEFDAFDLARALQKRDRKSVFRIYYSLEKNIDSVALLGALNWHYKNQYDKAEEREQRTYHNIFRFLHEADIAIKNSQSNAIENLIIRILRLDWKVQKQAPCPSRH